MGAGTGRCCNVSTPEPRPRATFTSTPSSSSGAKHREPAPPPAQFKVKSMKEYRAGYKEKGATRKGASVFTVVSTEPPGQYACRKIASKEMPCQSAADVAKHLQALSNLEHPHVCRFIEAFEDKTHLYLVYEKANPVTLFEHIRAKSSLTEEEAADYLRQAAMVFSVAHSQGIVHGRFSPKSIILADEEMGDEEDECDTQIKICDMGQGFVLRPAVINLEDTPKNLEVQKYAISPELACRDLVPNSDGTLAKGADKNDIWALGVTFYHMLSGVTPFKVGSRQEVVAQMQSKSIKFHDAMWGKLSNDARDLIEQMMRLNASIRISAAHILKHPWVKVCKATFPRKRMVDLLANMHHNVEECEFKRFVLRLIAEQLPSDGKHICTVETAFRCLDRNGDGILTVEEVVMGLKKHLNKGQDDREIEDLFAQIDRDGSGTLNVQEFVSASMPQCRSTSLPVLWEAFNAFDKDRSGQVTFDEIDRIVREIEGASLSKEQVAKLCEDIRKELQSIGTGGYFDFDQFVYLMKNSDPNFQDAIQKNLNRWLWERCGVDSYKVRHLEPQQRWDFSKVRSTRSVYRRKNIRRGEDAEDEMSSQTTLARPRAG